MLEAARPNPAPTRPLLAPGFRPHLVAMMIFAACATAGVKIGFRAADWLILRHAYGDARVQREHLTIVNVKPTLIISNGDRLKSHAVGHFFIACAIFIAVSVIASVAAHLLLPRHMKSALRNRDRLLSRREEWSYFLACGIGFLLAIPLAVLKPLWLNAVVVVLAIAVAHCSRPHVRVAD